MLYYFQNTKTVRCCAQKSCAFYHFAEHIKYEELSASFEASATKVGMVFQLLYQRRVLQDVAYIIFKEKRRQLFYFTERVKYDNFCASFEAPVAICSFCV